MKSVFVKSHKRRLKSGKVITVQQYTTKKKDSSIKGKNLFDQKRLLKEVESEAKELTNKDWEEFTPEVCNKGFCDIWAEKFQKRVGGEILSTEAISDGNKTLGHVVVKYKGKYYDAESPKGSSNVMKLPFFIRAKAYNKKQGKTLQEKDVLSTMETY